MGRRRKNPYKRADRFTRQAKSEGFKARSVFKLSEIQKRFRPFSQGQRIVDLGCYPGSWSQYALQRIGGKGTLVGVDLTAPELGRGTYLERSIYDVGTEELLEALEGRADGVLSDMAPKTTGVALTDHVRQMELARRAFEVACEVLAPGGFFVVKVFDGEEVPAFQTAVRARFGKVKRLRPEAVRRNSREFFLLGLGFRPEDAGED